jgi:hypothetical protein
VRGIQPRKSCDDAWLYVQLQSVVSLFSVASSTLLLRVLFTAASSRFATECVVLYSNKD